jgi:hypothetical protein
VVEVSPPYGSTAETTSVAAADLIIDWKQVMENQDFAVTEYNLLMQGFNWRVFITTKEHSAFSKLSDF